MAAPSYATDLNDIQLEMASTTGWTLISSGGGGANSLTAPETDDFIQGNNCISRNPWTSANIRGMVYNSTETVTADDALFIWAKSDVTQALDTIASGGLQVVMGDAPTTLDCFYVDGSDTAVKGGWRLYAVDPTATPSATVGGGSGGTNDEWGFRWSVATSGPNKGYPYKIDCLRHGRSVDITAGDSGTPATWAALATYADDGTRRWGVVQETDTGAVQVGITNWGTASTSVYSRDTGGTVVFPNLRGFVSNSFSQIVVAHASTDIEWYDKTFQSLDTLDRGLIDISSTDNPSFLADGCTFLDLNTIDTGGTNTDFTNCIFDSCNEFTARGGSIVGSSFLTPTVAADGYAVLYNETADPDGEFDNTTFSKGTNSHHAIEFGTSAPTTMTLRGIDFTGFSGTSTAAALNFLRTTGTTTVNLIGCTGTITAQVTGSHTVDFVINPVTTALTVRDSTTKAAISGAWAYLQASDGTGPLPFEDASTGWSRATTTATVTLASHNLETGQKVLIEPNSGSADDSAYGVKSVTVTGASTFTYTMDDAGATTGITVDITGVVISESTTAGGLADDTRSFTADQPVEGWVRKHTSSPYYKESPVAATIDKDVGYSTTVLLISDE